MDLYFITGADAWRRSSPGAGGPTNCSTWRTSSGVSRPGGVELESPAVDHLPADKVTLLEIPAMAISSTDCRQRVHVGGEPIWYLVPDGIVQYIAKRGLYQDGE